MASASGARILRSGDKAGQKRDLEGSASGISGMEQAKSKKKARAGSSDRASEKSTKNPVSSTSSRRFSKNSLLGKDSSDDVVMEPEASRKAPGKRGAKYATEGKKEKPVLYAMTDKQVKEAEEKMSTLVAGGKLADTLVALNALPKDLFHGSETLRIPSPMLRNGNSIRVPEVVQAASEAGSNQGKDGVVNVTSRNTDEKGVQKHMVSIRKTGFLETAGSFVGAFELYGKRVKISDEEWEAMEVEEREYLKKWEATLRGILASNKSSEMDKLRAQWQIDNLVGYWIFLVDGNHRSEAITKINRALEPGSKQWYCVPVTVIRFTVDNEARVLGMSMELNEQQKDNFQSSSVLQQTEEMIRINNFTQGQMDAVVPPEMVNLLNFKWQKDLRKKDDEESRGLRWSMDLQSLAADTKLRMMMTSSEVTWKEKLDALTKATIRTKKLLNGAGLSKPAYWRRNLLEMQNLEVCQTELLDESLAEVKKKNLAEYLDEVAFYWLKLSKKECREAGVGKTQAKWREMCRYLRLAGDLTEKAVKVLASVGLYSMGDWGDERVEGEQPVGSAEGKPHLRKALVGLLDFTVALLMAKYSRPEDRPFWHLLDVPEEEIAGVLDAAGWRYAIRFCTAAFGRPLASTTLEALGLLPEFLRNGLLPALGVMFGDTGVSAEGVESQKVFGEVDERRLFGKRGESFYVLKQELTMVVPWEIDCEGTLPGPLKMKAPKVGEIELPSRASFMKEMGIVEEELDFSAMEGEMVEELDAERACKQEHLYRLMELQDMDCLSLPSAEMVEKDLRKCLDNEAFSLEENGVDLVFCALGPVLVGGECELLGAPRSQAVRGAMRVAAKVLSKTGVACIVTPSVVDPRDLACEGLKLESSFSLRMEKNEYDEEGGVVEVAPKVSYGTKGNSYTVWYFTQTETSRVKIEGGMDLAKNVKVDVMESFGKAKVLNSRYMMVRGGGLDLGPLFPGMALEGVVQRGALCVDLSAGPGRVAAFLGAKECTVVGYFSALSDQYIGGRGKMNRHNGWEIESLEMTPGERFWSAKEGEEWKEEIFEAGNGALVCTESVTMTGEGSERKEGRQWKLRVREWKFMEN